MREEELPHVKQLLEDMERFLRGKLRSAILEAETQEVDLELRRKGPGPGAQKPILDPMLLDILKISEGYCGIVNMLNVWFSDAEEEFEEEEEP